MNAGVVGAVVALAAVLLLAEVSARLWRRRHPTDDPIRRLQQAGIFRGAWMLTFCVVLAVLLATHVIAIPH